MHTENAAQVNHTSDARPRIEHIETIAADDIPRFGTWGDRQLSSLCMFIPMRTH